MHRVSAARKRKIAREISNSLFERKKGPKEYEEVFFGIFWEHLKNSEREYESFLKRIGPRTPYSEPFNEAIRKAAVKIMRTTESRHLKDMDKLAKLWAEGIAAVFGTARMLLALDKARDEQMMAARARVVDDMLIREIQEFLPRVRGDLDLAVIREELEDEAKKADTRECRDVLLRFSEVFR